MHTAEGEAFWLGQFIITTMTVQFEVCGQLSVKMDSTPLKATPLCNNLSDHNREAGRLTDDVGQM